MRMVYAAERMSQRHACALTGFDSLGAPQRNDIVLAGAGVMYDIAVLPIFTDGTETIRCPFANRSYDISILPMLVKRGGTVFAGKVFPALEKLCEESGFELHDYLCREELSVRNAMLTAEGALETAIRETAYAINGSDVMILGFGRISKFCASYFTALGASVTVAARKKSDLAWAESLGYRTADFADDNAVCAALSGADIIINTVPAGILTGKRGASVRRSSLLIELASVPCTGKDTEIRTVKAGGLPGKIAPVTAGRIIADTVENILTERSKDNGKA